MADRADGRFQTPAEDEPSQQLGGALAAGAVGLAVIAGSLLALRRVRKRALQER